MRFDYLNHPDTRQGISSRLYSCNSVRIDFVSDSKTESAFWRMDDSETISACRQSLYWLLVDLFPII